MSKIRNAAKGHSCALQIPGICNNNPETVVLAHLPSDMHGMALKSPDWWGVHACECCHAELDRRTRHLSEQERAEILPALINDALFITWRRLIDEGLIEVKNGND